MVADSDIAHQTFPFRAFHRHRKHLRTVGRCYAAAVAVGLLLEMIVLLYLAMVVSIEFLIPLDRAEIGGCKQSGGHGSSVMGVGW